MFYSGAMQRYVQMISRYNLLRVLLLGAGLGWGLTVVGVFLPWNIAIEHLEKFGGSSPIPDDPMMNYWLRGDELALSLGLPRSAVLGKTEVAWKYKVQVNIIRKIKLYCIYNIFERVGFTNVGHE